MSQKQYSTRLPEDDAERLEEYCDETNISKSEALRRSVREYVSENGSNETRPVWFYVIGTGIAALLVNQFAVPVIVTGLSVLAYLSVLVYALVTQSVTDKTRST
jgi:hypothetical protein